MTILSRVRSRTYRDSVQLMQVSQRLSDEAGVVQAFVAMGTEANQRVLDEVGLLTEEVRVAGPNDLVLVVEADSQSAAEQALARADGLLAESGRRADSANGVAAPPRTLAEAAESLSSANLALISVPGAYAALEAARAIGAGLDVFLFSDNVPLEDELALKRYAAARGRLVMGPGCGTAVINGIALGFANVVSRGPIGVVAASGTGLQEVTSLVDRAGSGISQAIGVGGRDLSATVGGLMMRRGIEALAADPETKVLVLLSKPPADGVRERVLAAAAAAGKPVIVNFLGGDPVAAAEGVHFCDTFEQTAREAVRRATGIDALPESSTAGTSVADECARFAMGQRFLRGLFSGGSLCDEAMLLLGERLPIVYSNIPLQPGAKLDDAWRSREHTCVDLGEEEFTEGRPHPMIDLRVRQARLEEEARDPEVAVVLMDVVIGYGSHPNPAAELAETIVAARRAAANDGRHLSVVAHVCGTAADPQGLGEQESILGGAGVLVLPTNAEAARVATEITLRVGER